MLVGRRNIQNTNNAMQAPPINRIFFDPPLGAVTAVTAGRSVTATVVVVSTSSMALVFSACAGFSLSNVAASLAESKWADALEREASSIALLEGVCQFQLLCETSRPLSWNGFTGCLGLTNVWAYTCVMAQKLKKATDDKMPRRFIVQTVRFTERRLSPIPNSINESNSKNVSRKIKNNSKAR